MSMTRRAVYTIRDHEGWVRYVGSSGLPEGRYAGHLNSDTPIGNFMRAEYAADRGTSLKIEEWLDTKQEGFRVERLYIAGYARLSGDKLLNVSKPKAIKDLQPHERCMREGCNRKLYTQGVCYRHFYDIQELKWKLPKKHQHEYVQKCIEAGLLLEEPKPEQEITPISIFYDVKEIIKGSRRKQQGPKQ